MKTPDVYVVGGPDAHIKNQWEAMTNSRSEAEKIAAEIPGGQVKKVDEKHLRARRRRRKRA